MKPAFTSAMLMDESKSPPPPIDQSHVYGRIKIFEKGHPRNIPVKLFQNRPAVPETIFKGFLTKFNFVAMATRVLMESNSVNNRTTLKALLEHVVLR